MLIFCPTKFLCEKVAAKLAVFFGKLPCIKANPNDDLSTVLSNMEYETRSLDPIIKNQRENLIANLRNLPCGLCPILSQTIKEGIAYHHSVLTAEARKIIEEGYRKGLLSIIVATSTLSTGINLPAKAVIFQKPYAIFIFIIGWDGFYK